jgi:hypothetical protein
MTEIKDFLLVDVDGDSGDVHVETEEARLLQSQINEANTGNQEEETEDVELYEEDKERTIGAGLLVGVLALPFGLVAGVLAGASAAYASTKPGVSFDAIFIVKYIHMRFVLLYILDFHYTLIIHK